MFCSGQTPKKQIGAKPILFCQGGGVLMVFFIFMLGGNFFLGDNEEHGLMIDVCCR